MAQSFVTFTNDKYIYEFTEIMVSKLSKIHLILIIGMCPENVCVHLKQGHRGPGDSEVLVGRWRF